MKRVEQILAGNKELIKVETTSSGIGYPENLKSAIIGFDNFEEARKLAEENNLEIETFYKKNGWNLWARSGNTAFEAFTNSAEDFGDNYLEVYAESEADFIENEVDPIISNNNHWESFEEYTNFLKEKKEVWEQIEEADPEKEVVITYCGRYFETLPKKSMQFNDQDVTTYVIGLIDRK